MKVLSSFLVLTLIIESTGLRAFAGPKDRPTDDYSSYVVEMTTEPVGGLPGEDQMQFKVATTTVESGGNFDFFHSFAEKTLEQDFANNPDLEVEIEIIDATPGASRAVADELVQEGQALARILPAKPAIKKTRLDSGLIKALRKGEFKQWQLDHPNLLHEAITRAVLNGVVVAASIRIVKGLPVEIALAEGMVAFMLSGGLHIANDWFMEYLTTNRSVQWLKNHVFKSESDYASYAVEYHPESLELADENLNPPQEKWIFRAARWVEKYSRHWPVDMSYYLAVTAAGKIAAYAGGSHLPSTAQELILNSFVSMFAQGSLENLNADVVAKKKKEIAKAFEHDPKKMAEETAHVVRTGNRIALSISVGLTGLVIGSLIGIPFSDAALYGVGATGVVLTTPLGNPLRAIWARAKAFGQSQCKKLLSANNG